MNKKYILLGFGIALVCLGLFKPNIPVVSNDNNTSVVSVSKPEDPELLDECEAVIKSFRDVSSTTKSKDANRLASLYVDLANLISLKENDEVIKNTEEIRQANKLAGTMLRLGIQDKYPDLQQSSEALIVAAIGNDSVELNDQLRNKASDAFKALAWSCIEGTK